jgi:4'-phosphopantetheinyl transferase
MQPEEREKEDRMRWPEHRRLQRLARGLVRSVLSHHFSSRPESWRFAAQAHGKPCVPALGPEVDFNISHTQGLVAVALSVGHRVGVDVEWLGREPAPDLAAVVMSPHEYHAWQALPHPAEQHARLLTLWTLKEAGVKASGQGLSFPVQSLSFDIDDQGRANAAWISPMPDRRWACMRIGATHQLAICLQGRHETRTPLKALSPAVAPALDAWPPGSCTHVELA